MFHTYMIGLFMCCLIDVFGDGDEVKSVIVMEGDSVTLHTHITDKHRIDGLEWRFGSQEDFIVRYLRDRFLRNGFLDDSLIYRLRGDDQTGSLTITDITTEDSGLWTLIISDGIFGDGKIKETLYRFNVTVFARVPVPVITRDPSVCLKCVLLCSVMNVTHVSLSWYKGKSLLSSISVSDLNIRLSLPLEVDHHDTNTYRCVLNHPNTNQTQHLNVTQHCYKFSDCLSPAYAPEAVIRLVVSALVGVAAVAASIVLIYDIRSRRAEQKRTSQITSTLHLEIQSL
ncbi:uncharacterized protein LOC130430602 [Triplophysa dalaica]|uniref:uncharacterized protein LOC130430602 n=1 Tax=Triplophysa dalaica TaxID=1582913 RepID=UPI0024E03299|nr:uncharacterized protein LOC130430602 [Triplophysa dalaica]